MRINKLSLLNFKGIKELIVEPNGRNVNAYGDNATGKTTIADAFNWLLNGKDSLNRSDFGIKPIDPETQEPVSGIETVVEAVLDLGGGTLTLKKVFYENWVKERGAAERTFKGNTTDYFLDDVPVKKTEYDKRIQEIADEKAFKLLTNPLYFNDDKAFHWTERRKMLLQVCGDISVDEVMETNSKLSGLKGMLGTHDVESHKKMIAAKKTEINKELEKIPARITEVKNLMPDITGIVVSVIQNEIADLRKQQDELRAESVRITSGGEIAEKNKRLAEINAELIGLQNVQDQKKADALKGLREQENVAVAEHRALQNEYLSKQGEIETCGRQIVALEAEIENLYEQYDKVDAEEYAYRAFEFKDQASICPTCGQDIPQERIDAVREAAVKAYEEEKQKAIEKFNLDKSSRLEKITAAGKAARKTLEDKQAEKVRLESELAVLKQKGAAAKVKTDTIQAQIQTAQNSFMPVSETPEYKLKSAEMAQVRAAITELQNDASVRVTEIQNSISELSGKITTLQVKITSVDDAEKYKARIEELKADEKRLAKEYEHLESELFVIEEFIRTKVKMLDEKINGRFKYVRFKLFNQQINGALEECCEALINTNGCWTPYSDANAAGRINGGIDIINTLSEYYCFEAPIFIDNAESVVDLAETKTQAIRLIVSGSDKTLRIEMEDK
jgi:chromosome segregation ATPase